MRLNTFKSINTGNPSYNSIGLFTPSYIKDIAVMENRTGEDIMIDRNRLINRMKEKNGVSEKEAVQFLMKLTNLGIEYWKTDPELSNSDPFEMSEYEIDAIVDEANNIIGIYNAFVTYDSYEFNKNNVSNEPNKIYSDIQNINDRLINDYGIKQQDIKTILTGSYFEVSNNPHAIKSLLSLQLNYNKALIQLLEHMLRFNYKSIIFDPDAIEAKFKASYRNMNQNNIDLGKMVRNNESMFVKNSNCIDLSPIGLGALVVDDVDASTLNLVDLALDKYIKYLMTYDVTVLFMDTLNYDSEYDDDGEEIACTVDWVVDEEIVTPGGVKIRKGSSVYDLTRALIKEKFKRICLISPNGGSEGEIPYGFQRDNNVHIVTRPLNFGKSSFESLTPYSDSMIESMESKLSDIAESYGIDYNNNDYLLECMNTNFNKMYVQENILKDAWDSVVKFAKKVLGAIIGFFKAIINFVRNIIQKIKEKFKKVGNFKSKSMHIKVYMISLDGTKAKLSEEVVDSLDKLENISIKYCTAISAQIQKLDQKQTKLTKDFINLATKMQREESKNNGGV